MYMTVQKANKLGIAGDIKIFCNGKPIDQVIDFMTGKRGFVTCYEFPYRVIGDCAMRFQMRGNVSLSIAESK